ncbi:MAG: NAD-dependent succinate-semialdehyde dehydrogenase [Bacteroidetes bacterium]|nr:NAD-dependent succinate-semialdehyde dehydrogenase [Bacteroidota bacterium]
MKSINPFDGSLIAEYPPMSEAEIADRIAETDKAFAVWSDMELSRRSVFMERLGELLEQDKEKYARIITAEMGKPIREARTEVAKCAWLCSHFARNSADYLRDRQVDTEARRTVVRYEPLGVLFAIMPWNFPFWQVMRFAVPALMAGNTVLFKHAPNVTGCGRAITEAFAAAGFPQGVVSQLVMDVEHTEMVIAHAAVRGVSITGSERAGRSVAALAGRHLKKVALELGGSDAFIVFPDAELGDACTTGMRSRMLNAGQVCIAAKRFLVHEDIYDAFVQQQLELLQALQPGNPMDEHTEIGPMARPDLMLTLTEQLSQTLSAGAKLSFGGRTFPDYPNIFMPTLVENVRPGMRLWDEETFGPVMCLSRFGSTNEAIALANASPYGLGASVWTSDQDLAQHVAMRLQTGSVFVNSLVKSDPRLPFGGIKNSGFGRELGEAGIKEFVNIKTYWYQ